MSTYHRNNPQLPQYWSPPSHIQGSLHCSSSQGQQTADIRFLLRGERGRRHFDDDKLVSFCQRCRVLAGFIMFNAPPSPPDRCREPAAIISSRSCGFMFLSVSQSGTLSGFNVGSMIMADNDRDIGAWPCRM